MAIETISYCRNYLVYEMLYIVIDILPSTTANQLSNCRRNHRPQRWPNPTGTKWHPGIPLRSTSRLRHLSIIDHSLTRPLHARAGVGCHRSSSLDRRDTHLPARSCRCNGGGPDQRAPRHASRVAPAVSQLSQGLGGAAQAPACRRARRRRDPPHAIIGRKPPRMGCSGSGAFRAWSSVW